MGLGIDQHHIARHVVHDQDEAGLGVEGRGVGAHAGLDRGDGRARLAVDEDRRGGPAIGHQNLLAVVHRHRVMQHEAGGEARGHGLGG
jgi:hypothetical protein